MPPRGEPVAPALPDGIGGPGHAIVLMGAPGAGKSTVGAILARRLGVDFVDVDAVIEQREQRSVSEIFATDGEPYFRRLERDTTVEMMQRGGVVSLGGGAVMNPHIRAAMPGHEVVWLKVSLHQAVRRIGAGSARPLLQGDARSRLSALLTERTPLYRECATLQVETDSRKARVVAREIIERLAPQLAGGPDDDETEPDDHLAGNDRADTPTQEEHR